MDQRQKKFPLSNDPERKNWKFWFNRPVSLKWIKKKIKIINSIKMENINKSKRENRVVKWRRHLYLISTDALTLWNSLCDCGRTISRHLPATGPSPAERAEQESHQSSRASEGQSPLRCSHHPLTIPVFYFSSLIPPFVIR